MNFLGKVKSFLLCNKREPNLLDTSFLSWPRRHKQMVSSDVGLHYLSSAALIGFSRLIVYKRRIGTIWANLLDTIIICCCFAFLASGLNSERQNVFWRIWVNRGVTPLEIQEMLSLANIPNHFSS